MEFDVRAPSSHAEHPHSHSHRHDHHHADDSDEEEQRLHVEGRRPPLRQLLRGSPLNGAAEGLLAVGELLALSFLARLAYGYLHAFSKPSGNSALQLRDYIQILAAFAGSGLVCAATVLFFFKRYAQQLRIGVFTVRRPTLDFFFGMLGYLACGLCQLFLMSASHGPDGAFLSLLENVTVDNAVNYYVWFELVLWMPIKEEIVYRGLVYGFFQDKQRHQPLSMLLSSTLYGFFHVTYLYAIGLCSGIFYSWTQVFFQYLIAVFYTLQFLRTGSLMEPILLSLTQNFFFTLYPSSRHFSIVAPVYIFQGKLLLVFRSFALVVSIFVVNVLLVASSIQAFDKKNL